jgi:hypothetical protein
MHAIRLGQGLAVAATLSLMLVIGGLFGLGVAIRDGVVVPPTLNLGYSLSHVVAYSTRYPDCPPSTQCPPQSVASPQVYYVVWSIHDLTTADQPHGRAARRVLVVPLRR